MIDASVETATVIEKHKGSALHPRAVGFTAHRLDFFRALGIAGQIPTVDSSFRLRRATVESLVCDITDEAQWTPNAKPAAATTPPR